MRLLLTLAYIAILHAVACAAGCASDPRLGTTGESCRSRSDCARGLACVRNTCIPGGLGVTATGRECYRVECGEDADCCADFVPSANCDVYEANCDSNPTLCLAYYSLCVCNESCVSDQCFDDGPGCTVDDHCSSGSRPYCQAGSCVACREHADCGDGQERCVEGACETGCVTDDQCPLLHACDAGACVERGCDTDRECILLLADGRATCSDGECTITCQSDWECDESAREVCHQGACVFAGCESDAECRIVLEIENEQSDSVRAECR